MEAMGRTIWIARRVALDTLLWYCGPAAFMAIYILGFALPLDALAPHLLIMAIPLAALALSRLTIARIVPSQSLRAWLSALLVAVAISAMIVYYCLVIVSLRSWGGVITWNVIPSYARQAPAYAETLGVPPVLAAAVAILMYLALVGLCRKYLQRFDWASATARRASGITLSAALLSGSGILCACVYNVSAQPWTDESEPVSLTLFHNPSRHEVQSHAIDALTAATLDRNEDAARAGYQAAPPGERRSLVLIVIDAQRPDHMGIYGYARDTTPNLSRLAQTRPVRKIEGVHASCPDTSCALLSLSSSKFPRQFSFRPFMLQQVMRRNGYRVHMILGGDHTRYYGLQSYYGEVDTFYDGASAAGYFMNDDQLVLDRLAAMPDADGAPTMFQFHLMSTHILSKHEEAEAHYKPAQTYGRRFYNPDIGPASLVEASSTNYYDNGVLKSDRMVGALLSTLEAKGYLRNTLVVITADHGEGLGEHGLFVHMNSVREQVLRIPLLMIAYGYEPPRPLLPRVAPAQVDIAPTILAELELPVPTTWMGTALQERTAAAFSYFEGKENFGLIDRRDPARILKYWAQAGTGAEHAFDLSADPDERHDVLAQLPRQRLLEWRARVVPGTPLQFAGIP